MDMMPTAQRLLTSTPTSTCKIPALSIRASTKTGGKSSGIGSLTLAVSMMETIQVVILKLIDGSK